jgi:hypothetical protein
MISTMTSITDNGRVGAMAYIDPVRPHVLLNFNRVIKAIFDPLLGLKPIYDGLTMCNVPLNGPLSWASDRPIPAVQVQIEPSKVSIVSSYNNVNHLYRVQYTINGVISPMVQVSGPTELFEILSQRVIAPRTPLYMIVIRQETTVTDVVVEFVTEALNLRHCIVVIPDVPTTVYFQDKSSGDATQPNPVTSNEVELFIATSRLMFRHTEVVRTQNETNSIVKSRITRKIMPYRPTEPKVVYIDLHSAVPGAARINATFYPIVVPTSRVAEATVSVNNRVRPMRTVAPYSLVMSTEVFVPVPFSTIPISRTPY